MGGGAANVLSSRWGQRDPPAQLEIPRRPWQLRFFRNLRSFEEDAGVEGPAEVLDRDRT